jgi:hypothetical protein
MTTLVGATPWIASAAALTMLRYRSGETSFPPETCGMKYSEMFGSFQICQ